MANNTDMSRTERNKNKKKPRNRRNGKSWVKRIFLTLFFIVLLGVVSGCSLFVYYVSGSPEITEDDLLGTYASELVDADGNVFYTLGAEQRDFASADEYPQVMKDAMLAIEDQRFDSHVGVDPIGIGRAAWGFVTNRGQIAGGGSTITQQLVKLSVFSTAREDQTLERKAQEAWLAVQLERQLSKEEILSLYMNRIHMAGNVYGVSTAAEEYYGKHVSELELHEAALFAGMAQAPTRYNPYTNPENAESRRNTVLNVMRDTEKITAEEAEEAKAVPIQEGLVDRSQEEQNTLVFDGYLTAVLEEVQEKTDFDPYTAGLRIETNLDMDAQEHLYELINSDEYLDFPDEELQTAVSLVEAETGQVHALGGGRNQEGQLSTNRATGLDRNIGSTIKPLTTYGPAIEYEQFSTYHQIEDSSYSYNDWSPSNYDNQYVGWQTLRDALVDSRNIPAARTFNEDLDMNNVEEFLTNLGIDPTDLNSDGGPYPQNAINGRMTPLQLAASYTSFANGGYYTEPYTVSRVVTQDGQEIDLTPETNQAMSDYTAYMITDVLKGVVDNNSDTLAISGLPQAGKTGTTNYSAEDREQHNIPSDGVPDSWYVGYTSNYSLSVWVGYDRQSEGWLTTNDGTRQLPRHIYREMMSYVSEDLENEDWTMPDSVVEVGVENGSNPAQLPGPNTPSGAIITELFVDGTQPGEGDVSTEYGEELSAPSGMSATYDEESDELSITWDEYELDNDEEDVSYVLNIDGQSTTVSDTEFSMDEPPEGDLTITLAVQAYGNTGPEASTSVTVPERDPDEDEEDEEDETEEDPPEDEDEENGEEEPEENDEEGPPEDEEEPDPGEDENDEDNGNEEEPPEESEENPDE